MRSRCIGKINSMYFFLSASPIENNAQYKRILLQVFDSTWRTYAAIVSLTPWHGCWNLDGISQYPDGAGHKSTVPWGKISSWAADSAQASGTGIVILNNRHHVSILLNIHWTTTLVQHQEKYCKDTGKTYSSNTRTTNWNSWRWRIRLQYHQHS